MVGQKTCLVIGAGAGIGGTVGRKFAEEGYHAALCRRSDIDGLNGMVEGLQSIDFKLTVLMLWHSLSSAPNENHLGLILQDYFEVHGLTHTRLVCDVQCPPHDVDLRELEDLPFLVDSASESSR